MSRMNDVSESNVTMSTPDSKIVEIESNSAESDTTECMDGKGSQQDLENNINLKTNEVSFDLSKKRDASESNESSTQDKKMKIEPDTNEIFIKTETAEGDEQGNCPGDTLPENCEEEKAESPMPLSYSMRNTSTSKLLERRQVPARKTRKKSTPKKITPVVQPEHRDEVIETIFFPTGATRTYFVDGNLFVYLAYARKGKAINMRCMDQRKGGLIYCNAFAVGTPIMQDETVTAVINFRITRGHSHIPDHRIVQDLKLRRDCYLRAISEAQSYIKIFNSEIVRYPLARLSLRDVRRGMQRLRDDRLPRDPVDLEDFRMLLGDSILFRRDQENLPFYRGCLTSHDSFSCVFIPEDMKHTLSGGRLFHADATFKRVPGTFTQLLTLHVVQHDCAFPVVYALMNRRTTDCYVAVLTLLKEQYNFMPASVMTDFEHELQEAFLQVFPDVELSGCLFYFCQAIIRKAQRDLRVSMRNNSSHMQTFFRMIYALPLLPEHMAEHGIAAVEYYCHSLNKTDEERQVALDMLAYLRRTWIETIPPSIWNVYGHDNRTNNVVENFHNQLYHLIDKRHPDYWFFISKLKTVNHRHCLEFLHAESNRRVRVAEVARRSRQNQQFQKFWSKLPVNPSQNDIIQFLGKGGHLIAGGLLEDAESGEAALSNKGLVLIPPGEPPVVPQDVLEPEVVLQEDPLVLQ